MKYLIKFVLVVVGVVDELAFLEGYSVLVLDL
jgi:hypothetical protein